MVRRSAPKSDYVSVIADNPKTIEGLYGYFTAAGVVSSGTHKLDDLSMVPPAATAVVLFPDDFQSAQVEAALSELRRARPKLLIIVVTGGPQHLGVALEPDGRSVPPLVLPKPAFGWTILDAIRGRAGLAPL